MNRLLLCGLAVSAMLATTGGAAGSGQSGRYKLRECLAEQDDRPETARTEGQDRAAP